MKRLSLMLCFLLSFTCFSASEKKLKLGVVRDSFTESRVEGRSLNELMIKLLGEEMGYELEISYGNWDEIKRKFFQKEVEVMFPLERNYKEDLSIQFSENIYPQLFYIASDMENIRSIDSLQGKTIYTQRGSSYKNFLERILEDSNISAQIIEVGEIERYRDKLTARPEPYVQDMLYTLKVGVLPYTVLAYRGDDADFISRFNDELKEGYREKFQWHKSEAEKKSRIEFFQKALTIEERNFLENFKELNIAYEENSVVSHYVEESKSYRGLIPLILEDISRHLGFKINIINEPYEQWETLLERFDRGQSDILSIVRTREREKKYIFTRKIYDVKMYKIKSLNFLSENEQKKIGVIEDSIEHLLAKQYYKDGEIMKFNNLDRMALALRENKISAALNFDKKLVEGVGFEWENFSSVPMNFAFTSEKELLMNIIDKAYVYIVDKDQLMEDFAESERAFFMKRIEQESSLHSLWYKLALIFSTMLMMTLVILFNSRRERAKRLEKLAFVDSLTGLGNRYRFNKICKESEREEGTAIVVDLDNFKKANDIYGHAVGDLIIKYCAALLKDSFGEENVFRISGDEYYIFCKGKKCGKALEKLKEKAEVSETLKKYSITFSIGYFEKSSMKDMETCFKYADMAMYQAKLTRGNHIFEATDSFIEELKKSTFMKESLETAIGNEFYAVFQPKVSIEEPEKIMGAEALARWDSPTMGKIYPDEFIPLAEKMKLIKNIDFKIAEEAVKTLKKWTNEGKTGENFKMAFNISIYTLETEDVPGKIADLIKKYGVKPENLEVEITESSASKKPSELLKKLNVLKGMGINLSLDDFTAGHSTAGILPLLPLDMIKLDRSLLTSINNSQSDCDKGEMIYSSLLKMLNGMGFSVVAEGVEFEHDYDFMKANGVEFGQGYFFGKPVREDKFFIEIQN